MSNRLALTSLALSALLALAACGDEPVAGPDAGPPLAPVTDLHGRFALQSTYTLAEAPPEVAGVLAALAEATAGPDDPSRYLVDLVVSRLPDGDVRWVAQFLAPSIAAFLQAHVDDIAPRLAPGVRALAAGLTTIATQFGTREELDIDAQGVARRTLTALEFAGRVVDMPRVSVTAQATLETRTTPASTELRAVVSEHALRLDYSQLLRLGFDRAVIPAVVPDAIDLGGALAALVDCERLGALLAEHLAIGSTGMYARACTLGLAAAAAEIDGRMPREVTLMLSAHGSARAVDADRDGQIDTLQTGAWEGAGVRGTFGGGLR